MGMWRWGVDDDDAVIDFWNWGGSCVHAGSFRVYAAATMRLLLSVYICDLGGKLYHYVSRLYMAH